MPAISQALPDQFEKPKGQTLSAEFDESKRQALPAILSWTHYERLMRIKEKEIRDWYMREAHFNINLLSHACSHLYLARLYIGKNGINIGVLLTYS